MGYSRKYYKKKNKDNYELNKKLSKEYQLGGHSGESFTQFKKRMKKHLGY